MLAHLEEVHALATANLVASTQRDIAEQLARHDPIPSLTGLSSRPDSHSELPGDSSLKDKKSTWKKCPKKGLSIYGQC